ncbi:GGDEF domain-containing protein [Paucibacter soli]|uniref:GGDEF domain-containing protein n=1 Tax=Paucibacter soli TaxID=3133433 RepID=UPI003096F1F3
MQALDATTLLMVNAVFNCFGAIVWLTLALLFRIAPRAAWLMAAAHLSLLPALLPMSWGPWSGWWADAFKLAATTLLALAVRQLLRMQRSAQDILLIAALCALLLLGQALAGIGSASLLPTSVAISLLALLSFRDVLTGAASGFRTIVTALMAAPFAGLAFANLLRALAGLGLLPGGEALLMRHSQSALLATVWLLLCLSISIGLIALVLYRLITRIELLTNTDSLTGVLNRRALQQQLLALQAAVARGHPMTLLMVDVDHFKRVNDSLGHAGGDAALVHLVGLLRSGIREVDVLGRMGGEEFCLLLPDTTLADAAMVAERLRLRLQHQPFVWQGRSHALTASFGLAAALPEDANGGSALAQADAQLYRAKAKGRNQVCMAPA